MKKYKKYKSLFPNDPECYKHVQLIISQLVMDCWHAQWRQAPRNLVRIDQLHNWQCYTLKGSCSKVTICADWRGSFYRCSSVASGIFIKLRDHFLCYEGSQVCKSGFEINSLSDPGNTDGNLGDPDSISLPRINFNWLSYKVSEVWRISLQN